MNPKRQKGHYKSSSSSSSSTNSKTNNKGTTTIPTSHSPHHTSQNGLCTTEMGKLKLYLLLLSASFFVDLLSTNISNWGVVICYFSLSLVYQKHYFCDSFSGVFHEKHHWQNRKNNVSDKPRKGKSSKLTPPNSKCQYSTYPREHQQPKGVGKLLVTNFCDTMDIFHEKHH